MKPHFLIINNLTVMTQADLVRLFFAKGEKPSYWAFCFNTQCPLAKECALQLSVAYKDADYTRGEAVFPDAFKDGKCKHFRQLKLVRMAYGFEGILDELKRKDSGSFKVRMISYLGSSTSYYRYKLGQTNLVPEQQKYILAWCQEHGYSNMKFDRYTEEITYNI